MGQRKHAAGRQCVAVLSQHTERIFSSGTKWNTATISSPRGLLKSRSCFTAGDGKSTAFRLQERIRLIDKDGEPAWTYVAASLLRDMDDKPAGLVTIVEDVTELHLLGQQLRHQSLHDALTGLPISNSSGRPCKAFSNVPTTTHESPCVSSIWIIWPLSMTGSDGRPGIRCCSRLLAGCNLL